jgi:DNA sulfur modification protein DndD
MLIKKLKLVNFGPFFGEHELNLEVSANAPVVVLHGENMRGKTSILNAIRWCLYGDALSRQSVRTHQDIRKPDHRLISYDAIDIGQYFMRAELDFSHGGHDYHLERHIQSDGPPKADYLLRYKTELSRDGGHFEDEQNIPAIIQSILHKEISQFFLFDGEMLAEYEDLVIDPRQSYKIKQAIERILGLPALRLAIEDLESLTGQAQRRQTAALKQGQRSASLAKEARDYEAKIESQNRDMASFEDRKLVLEQEKDELEEKRERFTTIEADLTQASLIQARMKEAELQKLELQGEIREHVSLGWWEPVASSARLYLQQLEAVYEEARKVQDDLTGLRGELASLSDLTNSGVCPVCAQPLHPESKNEIEARAETLKSLLTAKEAESKGLDFPDAGLMRGLREIGTTQHLPAIQASERVYRRLDLDIRRDQRTLNEINERLAQHPSEDIRQTQRAYDAIVVELDEVERNIRTISEEREETRRLLAQVRSKISKLPEANPRIATEAEVYDGLRDLFNWAIEEFREELKLQVQEEASRIFKVLTTEDAYAGLSINDSYGLNIVDKANRIILERSAGAEQVVALSLIGALNRSSVREGPLVMDTPFGRLDTEHRKRILEFLPSLSPQVILLVQSGEMNLDTDLKPLGARVGRRYQLLRDGAPTRSRISAV